MNGPRAFTAANCITLNCMLHRFFCFCCSERKTSTIWTTKNIDSRKSTFEIDKLYWIDWRSMQKELIFLAPSLLPQKWKCVPEVYNQLLVEWWRWSLKENAPFSMHILHIYNFTITLSPNYIEGDNYCENFLVFYSLFVFLSPCHCWV